MVWGMRARGGVAVGEGGRPSKSRETVDVFSRDGRGKEKGGGRGGGGGARASVSNLLET